MANPARARWVVVLAAIVGMLATARLGAWQWDRARQKTALQQQAIEQGASPELRDTQLALTAAGAATQTGRRVHLLGSWVSTATVFLENRQMDGKPGFYVVTPLKLAGTLNAVLVQRGWTPRRFDDRTAVPSIRDPAGMVEVLGTVAPPPGRLLDFGSPGSGPIRQNIELDAFARETALPLLPMSIMQADSPASSGDGLLRRWPAPAQDVDRHYGYMIQWFGLCLLIAGLLAWFQWLKPMLARRRLTRP